MHTGTHIRVIRQDKKMSPEDLAEIVGISTEYLSEIEEERTEPAVNELLKIARAMGTDIAALLYGKEIDGKQAMITKPETRAKVVRAKRLDYESLAPAYAGRHMEPFLIEALPQDEPDFSRHNGEEFHYVLEGTLRVAFEHEEHLLEKGDSIYFDSSIPHWITAKDGPAKMLAVIYHGENMLRITRSRRMRDLIQAAKHITGKNLVLVDPNQTSIEAVLRAFEEDIVDSAVLVGDPARYEITPSPFQDRFQQLVIDQNTPDYYQKCSETGVEQIKSGRCQMIMKGGVNTAIFLKAVLAKDQGIGTGRRLSLVSIFELPGLDRLVFLSDPGINPGLGTGEDEEVSRDIMKNAIQAAKALGVAQPKVAILDANERPSEKVPSSVVAQHLSEMEWEDALVEGPLSYDLALYEESARHKGVTESKVAGKADVLIVPHISGGNFLYKAWAMTMGAEVANIVVGAEAPIIIASRSDTDMTKFLTICACAVYSGYQSR